MGIAPAILEARAKAAAYSLRRRVWIHLLVAFWLAWLLLDLAVTLYNIIAPSVSRHSQLNYYFPGFRFADNASHGLQWGLLLVPRELIIISAVIGIGLQLWLMLKFKQVCAPCPGLAWLASGSVSCLLLGWPAQLHQLLDQHQLPHVTPASLT